jgi:hypothetical protein
MKVQFLVTITVGPYEPQPKTDFERNDGKAISPYLKEKLSEAIEVGETWQYNAIVKRSTVKKYRPKTTFVVGKGYVAL